MFNFSHEIFLHLFNVINLLGVFFYTYLRQCDFFFTFWFPDVIFFHDSLYFNFFFFGHVIHLWLILHVIYFSHHFFTQFLPCFFHNSFIHVIFSPMNYLFSCDFYSCLIFQMWFFHIWLIWVFLTCDSFIYFCFFHVFIFMCILSHFFCMWYFSDYFHMWFFFKILNYFQMIWQFISPCFLTWFIYFHVIFLHYLISHDF